MTLPLDPSEPLVLADGTKIDTSSGKKVKDKPSRFRVVDAPSEAQAIVARTRRSIAELPLDVRQMNVISVVFTYTMWGLGTQDVAIALGITTEQVTNIRALPEYKTLQQDIMTSIQEHEANNVRQLFVQAAAGAAEKIIDIADEDDGVLGFKASQDILDRAGLRPVDIVQHNHTMAGSLRIEHVRKSDPNAIPMVDITNGAP